MNRCPITYLPCEGRYARQGLRKLSRSLERLDPLPYSAAEQLREAAARAPRMSIQGVQPKLSAVIDGRMQGFRLVDTGGRFILKPPHPQYPALPENEDLSMRLAAVAGVQTPFHGLVYAKDGSMSYFIKRFDRVGAKKLAIEDFAQLMGLSRETKYDASMEKLARVIERFCTFPMVEKVKLFRLSLINFLIGNEDMHAKNFSLMTCAGRIELTPAYDLVNTTVVLDGTVEETALPLMGKRRKLDAAILIDYFGRERLGLTRKVIASVTGEIRRALPRWRELIGVSFLPDSLKIGYQDLLKGRVARLLSPEIG